MPLAMLMPIGFDAPAPRIRIRFYAIVLLSLSGIDALAVHPYWV